MADFKQSWNSAIKRWVLIDCRSTGKQGGITGKVSKEPFPDVPISKGRQKEVKEPTKKQMEGYKDKPTKFEKEIEDDEPEKDKGESSAFSFFGL